MPCAKCVDKAYNHRTFCVDTLRLLWLYINICIFCICLSYVKNVRRSCDDRFLSCMNKPSFIYNRWVFYIGCTVNKLERPGVCLFFVCLYSRVQRTNRASPTRTNPAHNNQKRKRRRLESVDSNQNATAKRSITKS